MSRGLPRRQFLVFNGGGVNTKTDPRLVPAGELIEIENMDYLRTGELRLRNGFAAIAPGVLPANGLDNLFAAPGGVLSAIPTAWGTLGRLPVKHRASGGAVAAGWGTSSAFGITAAPPYPTCTANVRGVAGASQGSGTQAQNLVDCDMCVANNTQLVAWREDGGGGGTDLRIKYLFRKLDTGQQIAQGTDTGATQRPPVCVAGGSSYVCMLFLDTAGVPSLIANCHAADLASNLFGVTLVLNGVSAAQPWFDAKPIPGGNNIAVAWRANAGGVSCGILNPATGAMSAIVNTAAADASMCLGWLDDSLATGNMYLATAGSGAGVVVRTMNAATMAVTATNVIDATATTSVVNITGHINTGATNYYVFWDNNSGAATYYSFVRRAAWTGAAAVVDHVRSYELASRTFLGPDGKYHFIGLYDSQTQPSYSVLTAYPESLVPTSQAQLMPNNAGQARKQSSLSSPTLVGTKTWLVLQRRNKTAFDGVGTINQDTIADVALSFSGALRRPRELGGTFFMPGGVVMRDDGTRVSWGPAPFYPEQLSGTSSNAGGSLTAGATYSYRAVWRRIDAAGRICRTAASVPFSITLGGADNRTSLLCQNPRLPPPNTSYVENFAIEIYRAGPAAAGNTTYNKVGEVAANYSLGAAGDTITFVDTISDANAAAGEILDSTGNVLEGFATPSCNLMEVCGNRLGIVNAEDPTEFWPSLEYKTGQGIKFNPLLAIKTTGDGYGAITALASMDGRWILFKSTAIYVISGDGPNDAGQGSFSRPQAVSLSVGTVLPGSVVATPDGIMFQAAAGIYLLDRGLGVTYVGKNVEQYTLAANVVDASLVSGTTKARFVMASGRCLTWDYHHKQWTTSQLRVSGSTVVACADLPSGWCYALADGTVLQETAGVYSDVNGTSTAIVPRVGFPALAFAGINGYARTYGLDILGEHVGDHTLAVDFEYDYSGAVAETRTKAITAGAFQYQAKVGQQKASAIKITLRTSVQAAGSGAFRLSGVTLWAGMKKGSGLPYTKRLT